MYPYHGSLFVSPEVSVCGGEKEYSRDKFLYTALGDSITDGLAAKFLCGYAYRIYDWIKRKYPCAAFCNAGIPGTTSKGLLCQLRKSKRVRQAVRNSQLITISIGGNNLLKGTSGNYNCINERIIKKGIEAFCEEWPLILKEIREVLCSGAKLCVMTIYNPYCFCDRNFERADYHIREINSIIGDPRLKSYFNYEVVDVYSYFLQNRRKSLTFFDNEFFRDPHPNYEGNKHITKLFREVC